MCKWRARRRPQPLWRPCGAVRGRAAAPGARPARASGAARACAVIFKLDRAAQRAAGCRAGCGQLACQMLPGEAAWPRVGAGLELLPVEAGAAAVVRGAAGMAVLALGGGRVSDAHLAPGAAAPPRRAAAPGGRGFPLAGSRSRARVSGRMQCAGSVRLEARRCVLHVLGAALRERAPREARPGCSEVFVLAATIVAARRGAARRSASRQTPPAAHGACGHPAHPICSLQAGWRSARRGGGGRLFPISRG